MVFPTRRRQNKHLEPQFTLPVFGLQQKLLVAFTLLTLGLIISLLFVIESRYRTSIVTQVEKRGISIAENLAAVSRNALMTYDWTKLTQDAKNVSQAKDVLYAIILERDGKVVAHSERPDLLHTLFPSDPVNQQAFESTHTLAQYVPRGPDVPRDYYDVAAPISSPDGQKWGTVRVGLSLEDMHAEIRKTRLWIVLVGGIGGVCSLLAVAWLAGRFAAPIQALTEGMQSIARGELQYVVPVKTQDEIAVLTRHFNHMASELSKHRAALEKTNHELDQKVGELSVMANYNSTILASMTSGLMTLNLDGYFESINETAETILGVNGSAFYGEHYSQLVTANSPLGQVIERALQNRTPINVRRLEYIRSDGRVVPLGLRTAMRHDVDQMHGLMIIFEDLSPVQDLERRLRQADRLAAVGQVTAGLAHEIKNPLTSVRAFVQLVRQKHNDARFIEQFDRIVLHEVDRINCIIEELLDVTRSRPMQPRPVDILALLAQVAEAQAEMMEQHGVALLTDWAASVPSIRADPELLQRAFGNLTLNAIEAMSEGGTLTLTCRVVPKSISDIVEADAAVTPVASDQELYATEVEVAIQDTGDGIPSEQLDNLFTPFFTTKKRGTGLGLALTHKIIEDHGGSIHLASELGGGTTVTVRLPMTATIS
jgi:two-component system sensor histidine kinase AtoS